MREEPSPEAFTRSSRRSLASSAPSRRKHTSEKCLGATTSPPGLVAYPPLEHRREPDVLPNPLLEPERPKQRSTAQSLSARKRRPSGIDSSLRFTASSGDWRNSGTRLNVRRKVLRATCPERRAVHRHAEPLVRVHADRVGSLPALEERAKLRAHSGRARVGGVYMEPNACAFAHVGDRRDRVDRSRTRRPDRRDDGTCVLEREQLRPHLGTRRRPEPCSSSSSSFAALSAAECACSEQRTTRRPGRAARATASADSTPVEAVSSMWPWSSAGSPRSCASHSSDTSSSSWSAGEVRQRIPTWLSAAIRSSARTPGSEAVVAKYAKKRGLCQCVSPGMSTASRSAARPRTAPDRPGARAEGAARISPGSTCERTGSSSARSR